MNREEVFNKVAKIISNHFEIDTDKVTDELNIKDDLKADSISIMEFVLELEDEFGTEISDEDAELFFKEQSHISLLFKKREVFEDCSILWGEEYKGNSLSKSFHRHPLQSVSV